MPAGTITLRFATVSDDFDARLRREAQTWLTVRTHDGQVPLSSDELLDFEVDGRPFKLMDRQRGIRKPRELDAALSIRTVYALEGSARPYEDAVGADGLLRYKWRGDDPNHAENRALREAMRRELPLIWFCGVGQGVYRPVFPVHLLWEEREHQQFVLDPDVARGLVDRETPVTEHLRRYIRRETWQRLHQPVFRDIVLRAYETRCAVCALRHHQLLDAAHIVADRDAAGIASVRNGLALCKIPSRRLRPQRARHPSRPRRRDPCGPAGGGRRADAAARSSGPTSAAADGPAGGAGRTP